MPKKVLIIDDDENIVKYLSLALEKNGYEAFGAYDGKEGFDKVGETHPDLIVLDIMMPKRTGWVVFRQLHGDDQFKSIPVMMLTSVAEVLDAEQENSSTDEPEYEGLRGVVRKAVQQMREEGLEKPEMFLDKPVDPHDFIDKVRELIGE